MAKKQTLGDLSVSETRTEGLFREFYGITEFIEKSAIPSEYGFKSKKGTGYKGYPDFFRDNEEDRYVIIVEAKATDIESAKEEVEYYSKVNCVEKDIIAIAVSGQTKSTLQARLFIKLKDSPYKEIDVNGKLVSLDEIKNIYRKEKIGDSISNIKLNTILTEINNTFHHPMQIKDTERSLFFAGIMIALKDETFRNTYRLAKGPSKEEIKNSKNVLSSAHNLNLMIIEAIDRQIKGRINNYSKDIDWRGQFSFIKIIDYNLLDYKKLISKIEENIYIPFSLDEKLDILGNAYKIFLSKAGKVDNKNIILTPDHIKRLMVRLANLEKDDIILDTCTGTGGFLMEAMEVLSRYAKTDKEREKIHNEQLYGFESDRTLFALACSNMFLHGDGRSNLICGDSLIDCDSDIFKTFQEVYKPNKCIINPPYENNLPVQFVKKALEIIQPGGKLVVVMPSISLNKNIKKETKEILAMARLDFVIKLPLAVFREQNRIVYTSIFGFTKGHHRKDDEVLFFDLEDDGLVSIQHKGRVDKFKRWKHIEDLIYYTINNSREIKDVCQKRRIYEGDRLVPYGVQNITSKSTYPKISEIFKISKGELQSEKANEDGEYNFVTAAEEWKKHDMYQMETEAIVYAIGSEGSLGRAHYVNGKFMASNLCIILEEKDHEKYPVDLEYYAYHLMSIRKNLVSTLKDGTSKLTITEDKFKNYRIEYLPLEEQKRRKNIIKNKFKELEVLSTKQNDLLESLYDF